MSHFKPLAKVQQLLCYFDGSLLFICLQYVELPVCVLPAECSSDCQRCTADLQTGIGSVCLWCRVPRTWLLGDHCVSHCPRGHYGWHGACISKDFHTVHNRGQRSGRSCPECENTKEESRQRLHVLFIGQRSLQSGSFCRPGS